MKCRECEHFSRHSLYSFGWCKHNWEKRESDDDCNYVTSESISDNLIIGVDFSPNDDDILTVFKIKHNDTYVLNQFRNEEARELYNKLIGE